MTTILKNSRRKSLDGNIHVCENKYHKFCLLSVNLMEEYQARDVADAMLQRKSFTRLERDGIANPLYKYSDKSAVNMIISRSNISHDAQRRYQSPMRSQRK